MNKKYKWFDKEELKNTSTCEGIMPYGVKLIQYNKNTNQFEDTYVSNGKRIERRTIIIEEVKC